mgnify:CR=1 FL=1
MSKVFLRRVHIDGNEWKWIIRGRSIIIYSHEGQKHEVHTGHLEEFCERFYPNFELNEEGRFAVTPGRVTDYIESEILGRKRDPYEGMTDEQKLERARKLGDEEMAGRMERTIAWNALTRAEQKSIDHLLNIKNSMTANAINYLCLIGEYGCGMPQG